MKYQIGDIIIRHEARYRIVDISAGRYWLRLADRTGGSIFPLLPHVLEAA